MSRDAKIRSLGAEKTDPEIRLELIDVVVVDGGRDKRHLTTSRTVLHVGPSENAKTHALIAAHGGSVQALDLWPWPSSAERRRTEIFNAVVLYPK